MPFNDRKAFFRPLMITVPSCTDRLSCINTRFIIIIIIIFIFIYLNTLVLIQFDLHSLVHGERFLPLGDPLHIH